MNRFNGEHGLIAPQTHLFIRRRVQRICTNTIPTEAPAASVCCIPHLLPPTSLPSKRLFSPPSSASHPKTSHAAAMQYSRGSRLVGAIGTGAGRVGRSGREGGTLTGFRESG